MGAGHPPLQVDYRWLTRRHMSSVQVVESKMP